MTRTEKVELISIVLLVIMGAAMIAVFFITGNLSVLGEGVDNIFDVITCMAVILGVKISSRKTRGFPSGLYKVENLVAVFVGMMILYGAYELGKESIERLSEKPIPLEKPWLVLGVMIFVVLMTCFLALLKGRVSRAENSPSLKADSRATWTDALGSMVIVVGVLLGMAGVKHMDAITAMFVALVLLWSGLKVVIDSLKVLLDASIEKDVLEQVRAIVEEDARVRRVLSVNGRNSGSYRFIMISVIPRRYDLKEDRVLAEDLDRKVREKIEKVDRVTVDLGVEGEGSMLYAVPIESKEGRVAAGIGDARFFKLVEVKPHSDELFSREVLENPLADKRDGGMSSAAFLGRLGLNVFIVRERDIENNPYWILDECGVKVVSRPDLTEIEDLKRIVMEIESSN